MNSPSKRIRDLVEREEKKCPVDEKELHAIIINYQKKAREMTDRIAELEKKLEAVSSDDQKEKSRYKPLARKLKEERNTYREMLERVTKENRMMREELEKMKQLADKMKSQVKCLKNDIALKKSKAKAITVEAEAQTDMPEIETKHSKVEAIPDIQNSGAEEGEGVIDFQKDETVQVRNIV